MLQYRHCLAVVAETSRNDIFDSFCLQFLAFPFSVWNGIPFLSILFAAFPCQQTNNIWTLYSTVTICVEIMVSYIHGRKGGGVPNGRPIMARARREHKNDININVTGHSCKRRHGLSTNLRCNRNIEYRFVIFFSVFGTSWVCISARLLRKVTEVCCGFPQFLQTNAGISDWLLT
jgi:hypothetical protein